MNKLFKSGINAILFFAVFFGLIDSASAHLQPYVGLDVQKRHMFFEEKFGKNLCKHKYPQKNFYAGLRFNQFFGIELGYQYTNKLEAQVNLKEGERDFGVIIKEEDQLTVVVKNKLKGPHADFIFFIPVSDKLHLDLIAVLGISKLTLTLSEDVPFVDGIVNTYAAEDYRNFKQTRWVPRVSIGAQQKLTGSFSVRFLIGWEETKKFNNVRPAQLPSSLIAKTQNSINYSIGLIYHF